MGFEGESHTLALQIDGLDLARVDNGLSAARARSEDRRISNSRKPVYSLPNEILAIIFETACDLSHASFEPFGVLISQVKFVFPRETEVQDPKVLSILGHWTLAGCCS